MLARRGTELLNCKKIIKNLKYKKVLSVLAANEFGRLANGVGGRIKDPTNTIKFIRNKNVSSNRRKDVTYGSFV